MTNDRLDDRSLLHRPVAVTAICYEPWGLWTWWRLWTLGMLRTLERGNEQ
jgi:hypothetical protein